MHGKFLKSAIYIGRRDCNMDLWIWTRYGHKIGNYHSRVLCDIQNDPYPIPLHTWVSF